jgi:peptidoglycan/LPS O-acetylase OafA/YrhL
VVHNRVPTIPSSGGPSPAGLALDVANAPGQDVDGDGALRRAPVERVLALDVLRAIAVLLVLAEHATTRDWVLRVGWMGVDVFFVLSGFLVTGLLIQERQRFGRADVGRFLIRRGFKIYPSFWVMIATSLLVFWATAQPIRWLSVACELLFIQNYGPGLWITTWSLAVEEHFYLGVALLFAWLNRRPARWTGRQVAVAGTSFLLLILLLRTLTQLYIPGRYKMALSGTHVRIDALACGALIAFARAHFPGRLAEIVRRHRVIIALAAVALVAPVALIGRESLYVRTLGLSQLYLGVGGVLLLAIHARPAARPLSRHLGGALAAIGRASYGIYIWQLLVRHTALPWLQGRGILTEAMVASGVPFVVLAVATGILLTRAIELPMLALRDRLVPPRATAPLN